MFLNLLGVPDRAELSVPSPPGHIRVWHAANVTGEGNTTSHFSHYVIHRDNNDRGA